MSLVSSPWSAHETQDIAQDRRRARQRTHCRGRGRFARNVHTQRGHDNRDVTIGPPEWTRFGTDLVGTEDLFRSKRRLSAGVS